MDSVIMPSHHWKCSNMYNYQEALVSKKLHEWFKSSYQFQFSLQYVPTQLSDLDTVISDLQILKCKLQAIKWLVQGHPSQSWALKIQVWR